MACYYCSSGCVSTCEAYCLMNCTGSCMGTCSNVCGGGCTSTCMTACTTTCSGSCDTACTTTCSNVCGGGCTVTCITACTTTCSGSCDTACTTTCSNVCGGGCTGTCLASCADDCSAACTSTCSGTCTASCADDCSAACTFTCSGTCGALCADDCSTACTSTCSGTCIASCGDDCSAACTTTCSNACGGGCTGTCTATCADDCETACSATCSGTSRVSNPNPFQIAESSYNLALQNAQRFLTTLTYSPGSADGLWGTNTHNAINAFQGDHSSELSITDYYDYLDEDTYNLLDELAGGISGFWASRKDTWTHPLKGGPTADPQGGTRYFGASREGGARAHAGIDNLAEPGRQVIAMSSGTLKRAAYFDIGTYQVEVENDDGTISRYTELYPDPSIATVNSQEDVTFTLDQIITQGDIIGELIENNTSEHSCMLHLEVYMGDATGSLTQPSNSTTYDYVTVKNYERRRDLIDPTNSVFLRVVY